MYQHTTASICRYNQLIFLFVLLIWSEKNQAARLLLVLGVLNYIIITN